jgi:hypothetical protein
VKINIYLPFYIFIRRSCRARRNFEFFLFYLCSLSHSLCKLNIMTSVAWQVIISSLNANHFIDLMSLTFDHSLSFDYIFALYKPVFLQSLLCTVICQKRLQSPVCVSLSLSLFILKRFHLNLTLSVVDGAINFQECVPF